METDPTSPEKNTSTSSDLLKNIQLIRHNTMHMNLWLERLKSKKCCNTLKIQESSNAVYTTSTCLKQKSAQIFYKAEQNPYPAVLTLLS